MSKQNKADAIQEQHERQMHQQNFGRPNDGSNAPETLKYVTKPEDIENVIPEMGWVNSTSPSTANFSSDDVKSKEWVIEYARLLAQMQHPPEYGITGHRRAFVYDDVNESKQPLDPGDMTQVEGFAEIGKHALTRGEDGWAVKTSTRDTKESIVHDENEKNSGGGILSRLRG